MARLVQTERALIDTRQQVEAVPKVTVPFVDTGTIGKAPTFTGEHKDWPEWSFQFTAYIGSANPWPTEALRWAAMEEDKIRVAAVVNRVSRSTILSSISHWHCCSKDVLW